MVNFSTFFADMFITLVLFVFLSALHKHLKRQKGHFMLTPQMVLIRQGLFAYSTTNNNQQSQTTSMDVQDYFCNSGVLYIVIKKL